MSIMATPKKHRFAPKFHIRKGDTVLVISGADKGKQGEVLQMLPDEGKAIVRDVKVVKRHVKPTTETAGQIVEKEMPVDVSNLKLVVNGTPTKVGRKIVDGRSVRYAKATGEIIP